MPLISFTSKGLYCRQAGVYIDPWGKVDKALITHGHSDHARWGMNHYLCTTTAAPVIRYRLRLDDTQIQTVAFGEKVYINGVTFSFHPAGHVIGSAQIRVEYKGEIWVVSGDYKTVADGISEPFESIRCHHFITESTFGLPIYNWDDQAVIINDINRWWQQNRSQGISSILSAYALGKAQRILCNINTGIGPVFAHAAVENINQVFREQGYLIPPCRLAQQATKEELKGALVIAPPSAADSPWAKRFGAHQTGIASGWMALRGARRRRAADRGFVLSDHADWKGLNEAILDTGAETVYVTHGYSDIFAQWLNTKGIDAQPVVTSYGQDEPEESIEEVVP